MNTPNNRQKGKQQCVLILITCLVFSLVFQAQQQACASALSSIGLHVIPYPRQVYLEGEDFSFSGELTLVLGPGCSEADRFAAQELAGDLKSGWGIHAVLSEKQGERSVVLTRKDGSGVLKPQGYQLKTTEREVLISAKDEAGLFYGTRTFLQLIQKTSEGFRVPGLHIPDWPDIEKRAVHYDTKHHQDRRSYVESFIKDLAHYKINQLVWEWEDKLAYESHPEIGAPGAFTIQEMQDFTRFAKKYHVELVPGAGSGACEFYIKMAAIQTFKRN